MGEEETGAAREGNKSKERGVYGQNHARMHAISSCRVSINQSNFIYAKCLHGQAQENTHCR